MPRNYLMSWEPEPAYRWVKMRKGTRYRVSCAELGLPPHQWTKELSGPLANEWWQNQAGAIPKPKTPNGDIIGTLEERVELAKRLQLWEELPHLESQLKQIQNWKHDEPPRRQDFLGTTENSRKWDDRKRIAGGAVKQQNSVKANLENFLNVHIGRIKPVTFKELKRYLDFLIDNAVLPEDATKIDEQTVVANHSFLVKNDWEPESKNKRLGFFRRFVSWLYENGTLNMMPRNLKSKLHRFKERSKAVETFEDVKGEIAKCTPRCKLWALLGLNCGMTQADLGALNWNMIDLDKQTLTRKRVKTEDQDNVPVVRYWLWPETIAELKKLKTRKGLVFVTKDGKSMYETTLIGHIAKKKDNFSLLWKRQANKPNIRLGKFRSISATVFKTHKAHKGYVDYFLGHAPSDVTEKHYAGEDDKLFFEALKYVRKELLASSKATA